jgi:hypothetical protein
VTVYHLEMRLRVDTTPEGLPIILRRLEECVETIERPRFTTAEASHADAMDRNRHQQPYGPRPVGQPEHQHRDKRGRTRRAL